MRFGEILRGPADPPNVAGGGGADDGVPTPSSFPLGLSPQRLTDAVVPYLSKQLRRYDFPSPDVMRTIPQNFQAPPPVLLGLAFIAEYLALPIGEDTFTDDAARAQWRKDIEDNHPDTSKAYEHNKLRMNKISFALNGVENILPYLEWTKLCGMGDIPAAHMDGLRQTIQIWKKANPPETILKIDFVENTLIPMLQHVFDCALVTQFPPPVSSPPTSP